MLNKNIPTIDLHGEYLDSAIILTSEFIKDNILLKKEFICIIHGIGKDILRKGIHEYLKKEKNVDSFKQDFFNPGCTIVKLKIKENI